MDSMQIADFMNQRPEFESQQRSMRDEGIKRREDSDRNDFKSFLQDMRRSQDDKKRIQEKLDNNRSLSEIAEEMDLESKDDLKKLAQKIKEKLEKLSDGDEAALEELMALLAEMEALIEERLVEKLADEKSLEELARLLEELDIDLDLEGIDGDKKDLLALLDKAEAKGLFGEEEKMLVELKELIAKLKEEKQSGKLDLNEKVDDRLAQLKELLSDLNGELKTEQKADENIFFLKEMGQNNFLHQEFKLDDGRVDADSNSELLENNLLTDDLKLLEELSAEEINALLSKENEAADEIGDNLFKFDLANSGAELGFNAENLLQAQSAANEVEFNQFFMSENVLKQVGEELELMNISKGQNELTVELYPESLGKVDINVNLEDGQLVARIVTESNEVRNLMKNNLDGLKDLLQQKNIDLENVDITVVSEERLAQNTDGEAGSNSFSSQDREQREEFEFDLDELSEILEMTEIEVSAKDILTSDDIDYRV